MNQTSENGKKKLISGPSLAQMLAHKIYFKGFTSIGSKTFPRYHPMQFPGNLMNHTWENGEKPNSGQDFGLFNPNLVPKKFYCKFYLY